MDILAIGNSFSQDATRYLHQIAGSMGKDWKIANLYIPGCSLEQHFQNMRSDIDGYELQWNGSETGFYVSLSEALSSRSWDVITLQQSSLFSAFPESYQPYLTELANYIRKLCPNAKLFIHQTWAYEAHSAMLEQVHFPTPEAMFSAVEAAYAKAVADISADGMIPSGNLFQALSQHAPVHRDTFHASLGIGRLALGLLWYRVLSGEVIQGCPFRDTDIPVCEALVRTALQLVNTVASNIAIATK